VAGKQQRGCCSGIAFALQPPPASQHPPAASRSRPLAQSGNPGVALQKAVNTGEGRLAPGTWLCIMRRKTTSAGCPTCASTVPSPEMLLLLGDTPGRTVKPSGLPIHTTGALESRAAEPSRARETAAMPSSKTHHTCGRGRAHPCGPT